MGEVRKRKTSGEKNGSNGAEAPVVVQKRYFYVFSKFKILDFEENRFLSENSGTFS